VAWVFFTVKALINIYNKHNIRISKKKHAKGLCVSPTTKKTKEWTKFWCDKFWFVGLPRLVRSCPHPRARCHILAVRCVGPPPRALAPTSTNHAREITSTNHA
jgi:hypothetical protein